MNVSSKLSIEAIMVTKFVDLDHILASDPEPTHEPKGTKSVDLHQVFVSNLDLLNKVSAMVPKFMDPPLVVAAIDPKFVLVTSSLDFDLQLVAL